MLMLPPPPLLSPGDALFLDFDGTLVDFQDNPDAVRLSRGQSACLVKVAEALNGAMALISGRSLPDLAARTPTQLCFFF